MMSEKIPAGLECKSKAIVLTNASNVCGTIPPLKEIGKICDATSNQYIFNINTKEFTPGAYLLTINLDDGMAYSVKISLK